MIWNIEKTSKHLAVVRHSRTMKNSTKETKSMLFNSKFLYNWRYVHGEFDEKNWTYSYGETEFVSVDKSELIAQYWAFHLWELLYKGRKNLLWGRIVQLKCKLFNAFDWELDWRNQTYFYWETRVRLTKLIRICSNFWSFQTISILMEGFWKLMLQSKTFAQVDVFQWRPLGKKSKL